MKAIITYYLIYIYISLLHLTYSKQINYNYHTYSEILTIFKRLSQTCPQYIKIDTAQHRYGLDTVKGCDSPDSKCENLIIYLTDFTTYTPDRPQFYASGLVHGDEILGPTTITEFALYYCNKPTQFALNLLKHKMLIFTPMTNAYGYSKRIREDIIVNESNETVLVDPNRDFPYTKQTTPTLNDSSTDCMKTITARTINEIFKEHIIQSALTFHGGITVLGHPWGNFIHLDQNKHSTESPDHNAFRGIGTIMKSVSSSPLNSVDNIKDYVLGDMSKEVYPVDGGLEDWAYAGSWENGISTSKNPIQTCKPGTFKSYDTKDVFAFQLRCIMFLVEAADEKQPKKKTLGYYNEEEGNELSESNDVLNFAFKKFYGHIPRNMRLIFASADLIAANFYMSIYKSEDNDDKIKYKLEVLLMGCETVEIIEQHQLSFDILSYNVLKPSNNNSSTIVNSTKDFTCYWKDIDKHSNNGLNTQLTLNALALSNYNPKSKGSIVYYKGINPDKEWSIQSNPDPNIPPQSHIVKSKSNPYYNISNSNYYLKSNNQFYSYPFISFDNGFFIIADDPEALLYPIQEDISFIFYITSRKKQRTISKATVKFTPKTNNKPTKPLLYSSQIEYDILLLISIGGRDSDSLLSLEDLILNEHTVKENIKARIALSNIDDNKLTIKEHECNLYSLTENNKRIGDESQMLIKCNKLFDLNITNSAFIKNNLINSLLGLNWIIKENAYQLRGQFSAGKSSMGKYIESSLLDSSSSDYICNSHILPNFSMNLFEIKVKKISNKKFNTTFKLQKGVLDNPALTSYMILFPYADTYLRFNVSDNVEQTVELNQSESNGRILGKTVYVLKIQSESELNMVQSALKDKKYNDMLKILDSPLNPILFYQCSLTSMDLYNKNELEVNIVFSDKMPAKSLEEMVNSYLLMGLVGINVIGLIIVIIFCGIKLKRKLFQGYNKLETRIEMETIQIQESKKKETETV